MKFKREIIAILLVICMLFTISAISAADSSMDAVSVANATVEAASEDIDSDNNLAIKNDVESLGETDDGSFASLNTKISGASDTVYLWNDYEYSSSYSSTNGISIGNSMTIDGQGHKIDAKGQTRIFDCEVYDVVDVTIKNTIFANGKSEYGGAFYWYPDGGTLTLINCTFINNTATSQYGGGALLVYEASINVVNSTFINNSGDYGGAISGDSGEINNCSFYNNSLTSSTGLGSAIILNSGTVSNSIFLNNTGYVIYGSNVIVNYN